MRYEICVPFTGYVDVTVEVNEPIESNEQALEAAMEVLDNEDSNFDFGSENAVLGELEFHERIVQGNVFCGCLNEIDYQLEGGSDE